MAVEGLNAKTCPCVPDGESLICGGCSKEIGERLKVNGGD